MNRRSFLASLAAAAAAPQVLIATATDAFRWKKTVEGLWVLNPEWVNAPYELLILSELRPDGFNKTFLHHRWNAIPENCNIILKDAYPLRYGYNPTTRARKPIPTFIQRVPKRQTLFS